MIIALFSIQNFFQNGIISLLIMTTPVQIHTFQRPTCPACGHVGSKLYERLKDRFFDTPGDWSMKRCTNKKCGTLWLDPSPLEEDFHILYSNYSTHKSDFSQENPPRKKTFLDRIRESYLYANYGYGTVPFFTDKTLGMLAYLHPAWKDAQAANIFYIPYKKDGLLLDVGCGSGNAMKDMQRRGWKVMGIDFDKVAVESAKEKGFNARVGDLFSQQFPASNFDAILLNHVIEHIPSPEKIFKECYRILKPGGKLVMMTPNANARGHEKYGRNWRGLETPHHLQIFTPQSLSLLAKETGFLKIKSFSSLQGVFYILGQSSELARKDTIDPYSSAYAKDFAYRPIIKHLRWLVFGWLHVLFPGRDEVAGIICTK